MSADRNWIHQQLAELKQSDLWRDQRIIGYPSAGPGRIQVNGKLLLNFGSNDYLGLAGDKRLSDAAQAALEDSPWGSGSSPSVLGRTIWHQRLENRIAAFEKAESALLFSSGYAANSGVVNALVQPDDLILSDSLNHACLIDGCRLSKAKCCVYRHAEVQHVYNLFEHHRSSANRAWIITDSIFSMDGDAAPLIELAEVAEKFDAELIVDEAHGTGVYGPQGRGLAEELGVAEKILVRIGTLSKAVGCHGGFVSGSRDLVDLIRHKARSYIFSTAAPPANAAAAIAAIDWIETADEVRSALRKASVRVRAALREQGWSVPNGDSPIIPVVVDCAATAVMISTKLQEYGLFVPAIRPPTVPHNQSRLRISLSAVHTEKMLDDLVDGLDVVRGHLPIDPGR